MVSRYVEPDCKYMNSNVCRQVRSLRNEHDVNVEILTWPLNDLWTGPIPEETSGCAVQPLCVERGGLVYHVINPPVAWNERILNSRAWDDAIAYGVRLLEILRPDIVHLQHWVGLWWLLESAQRIGLPTMYSNHDWGMACLRTVLVMGDDSLCDGRLSVEKCKRCIWQGRGVIGKANEIFAETNLGRRLIEIGYSSPLKEVLKRQGAVRLPIGVRVDLNLSRAKRILSKLDTMFTPSEFGRTFFSELGTPMDHIQVKPWYHDPIQTQKTITPYTPFTITYIGRVSREKGVHYIFEAMKLVQTAAPIMLRIAGSDTSVYCTDLKKKYASQVGLHGVEWLSWSDIEPLFLSTDIAIIPSIAIDNTPLSLVEAFSYKVPVIATRVPPIEDLVEEGKNGYLAEYNSIASLAEAIQRSVAAKDYIRSGSMVFPNISTCRKYTEALKDAYFSIYNSNEIV